jgi:hypothetical protein
MEQKLALSCAVSTIQIAEGMKGLELLDTVERFFFRRYTMWYLNFMECKCLCTKELA